MTSRSGVAAVSSYEGGASPAISFDPWGSDGGSEFGVPAPQGYTFTKESKTANQELAKQAQRMQVLTSFPDILVDASGTSGVDGQHGEHGQAGSRGADGQHGKAGYGPGRPGKPGKPGRDGKPGTAGKKGKKGGNGTHGGRALNVFLSLQGEGPRNLVINGRMEEVVRQTTPPGDAPAENAVPSTKLIVKPLSFTSRLELHENQRAPLAELANATNREPSLMTLDNEKGAELQLRSRTGVIFIKAHGGPGGNGGNGGNGGHGGDGGDGGNGGNGGDGKKGIKPGRSGENGGMGGDGGAGMAGGAGGDGAGAGKGGNAGSGGQVTIETTKAVLLMLVEADTRAGKPGAAGRPGDGGDGGKAGKGGMGGRGGSGGPPWDKLYLPRHHKTKYYYGCHRGENGASGHNGGVIGTMKAEAGLSGTPALDGKEAKDGKVTWILKSPQGEIIEKAKSRYNCAVCQYRVRSTSRDGIISPGSAVIIDKVVVHNNGGMTLPAGTVLSFAVTGAVLTSGKGKKKVEILPALGKNKRHKCTTTFSFSLETLEGPAAGSPFQALVTVAPYLELGGRTFPVADQIMEIPVQYPLRIADNIRFPHTVHQGDAVSLKVTVQNVSTCAYGGNSSKKYIISSSPSWFNVYLRSAGNITVLVLGFVELEGGERTERSWRNEVPEIAPGQEHLVELDCRIDGNAQPYSLLAVQTHVLFRGQSIEFRHVESRVIPVYGGEGIDAVVLTDTDFRPGSYRFWKGLLAFLGLKSVFWDISWHRTYSVEKIPWLGKHRLVIFTHLEEDDSLSRWIRRVLPAHAHALNGALGIDNAAAIFVGPDYREVAREMVDWDNGKKIKDLSAIGCMAPFHRSSNEECLKDAVQKAYKMQKKMRKENPQELTMYVAPLLGPESGVSLMLYHGSLPTMFSVNTIRIKLNENPAGMDLLAASPLYSTQESPDIYSGISTAIGGLITNPSPGPGRKKGGGGSRIVLNEKHLTLGLMIAGMIISLPVQFRIDLLFRFAGHPPSDIPVLTSQGVTFTQVIGTGFYLDLLADWVCQRQYKGQRFPHGYLLVDALSKAVSTRGLTAIFDLKDFVVQVTGGLVLLRDELKSMKPSKRKARHELKGMLKQIKSILGHTNSKHIPEPEQLRSQYTEMRRLLPPWMFAVVDEQEVIRVVDNRGKQQLL
ncbi:hypothetical protein R1sor_021913 [Riccia sorocarpa]|uniref:DUF7932 domain-containing protein n=1 Tax=Riccia sorocarpa TaxID=122646 RepID=A0ABD3GKA6_9MARC